MGLKKLNTIYNTLTQELDQKMIEDTIRKSNVFQNRAEIYRNFIRLLNQQIYSTYFGLEFIKTNEDIRGHFNWCFTDTCEKFIGIGFDFTKNQELLDYFLDYYEAGLYKPKNNEVFKEKIVAKYFDAIFELTAPKIWADMSVYLDIYGMFDKSLSQEYGLILTK